MLNFRSFTNPMVNERVLDHFTMTMLSFVSFVGTDDIHHDGMNHQISGDMGDIAEGPAKRNDKLPPSESLDLLRSEVSGPSS